MLLVFKGNLLQLQVTGIVIMTFNLSKNVSGSAQSLYGAIGQLVRLSTERLVVRVHPMRNSIIFVVGKERDVALW